VGGFYVEEMLMQVLFLLEAWDVLVSFPFTINTTITTLLKPPEEHI
jgi:hypothetical protein